MKKLLSILFLLFTLNGVCFAEIMEDYRIACNISLVRFNPTVSKCNPIFHKGNCLLFLS
jgi:hypothetical protein